MSLATLKTMWTISETALPGYTWLVLRGLRSKKLAPAAWAMACVSSVFPVLGTPYRRTALLKGAFSCTALLPSGRMQYSVMHCRTCDMESPCFWDFLAREASMYLLM